MGCKGQWRWRQVAISDAGRLHVAVRIYGQTWCCDYGGRDDGFLAGRFLIRPASAGKPGWRRDWRRCRNCWCSARSGPKGRERRDRLLNFLGNDGISKDWRSLCFRCFFLVWFWCSLRRWIFRDFIGKLGYCRLSFFGCIRRQVRIGLCRFYCVSGFHVFCYICLDRAVCLGKIGLIFFEFRRF